ncbi:hypothetical protein ACFC06_00675 [Nocardia sp. NPDC056064]|uniref:hypothetical protein n=1 Tax=Nocardia sp. NPDC056064 TaxID=3345701 RepID=UPI0035D5CB58
MVAKGLEGGTTIRAVAEIDPTRTVPTSLLYGAISHLLLLAFGYAALHLAGLPAMFSGYDSSQFYAANGWVRSRWSTATPPSGSRPAASSGDHRCR